MAAPVVTDDRLIEQLVSEHGIVVIPMMISIPKTPGQEIQVPA